MITTVCLFSCALTIAQAPAGSEWQLSPLLAPGMELVYQGTYIDQSLIPGVQHQRQYSLEANLLVLDSKGRDFSLAFMTALSMQEQSPLPVKKAGGPTSVRIELATVDPQGRLRQDGKKRLEIPISGPPTLECGFFIPAPLGRIGKQATWDMTEEGQPVQRWQIIGSEPCGGVSCIKAAAVQQSLDWDQPRADHAAWRRRDTVWILPQMNIAQKVERIIERRDPARDVPTQRTVVRYELESRLKYPGAMFDDRRQEIVRAKKMHDDALLLVQKPGQNRLQIDLLLQRVSMQLDNPAPTRYPKAFAHLKTILENAKKGETLVPHLTDDPLRANVRAIDVGERAPDFAVSLLTEERTTRLRSFLGKPVLVLFYNPTTPTGDEVIRYAKQWSDSHKGSVTVMALAVTSDPEIARKQHRDLRLGFPILDGQGMRLTFGAEQTPRLVLLDGEGYVRLTQTGWGYHIPHEIEAALARCEQK